MISILSKHENSHSEEYYLNIRDLNPIKLTDKQKAARFIYLNKAGFNGLYRVNKSGKFNVPSGKKEKVKTFDEKNINGIIKYFSKSKSIFLNEDYLKILDMAKEGDFLFVDPPYDNSFNSYTSSGFGVEDQKNLASKLDELTKRGAKWILCNYNTNLIKSLYKQNDSIELSVVRSISSDGEKRSNHYSEVFYFNYKIDKKRAELVKYISSLTLTNNRLEKLVDWKKVENNIESHKLNLNTLDYFIGAVTDKEIKQRVQNVFEQGNEKVFKSLQILVAKRDGENIYLNNNMEVVEYNFETEKEVFSFIKDSNLKHLFGNVSNLKDYVFGVEVGLDTNGRKNRSGQIMEKVIRNTLNENKIEFNEQVKVGEKIIDFVFNYKGKEINIESSFYNGGGSKVSETLRSYVTLTNEYKTKFQNKRVIWIADGKGLETIKNSLYENWNKLEIMNIKQLSKKLENNEL